MDCNSIINIFLALDNDEKMPFKVKMHLLHCKQCRKLISKLSRSTKGTALQLHDEVQQNDPLLCSVMNSIYRLNTQYTHCKTENKTASFLIWLTAGLLILIGFVTIPLSTIGKTELSEFGNGFHISFALLCAVTLIVFSAIFILKNIAFFTKKLDTFNHTHRSLSL